MLRCLSAVRHQVNLINRDRCIVEIFKDRVPTSVAAIPGSFSQLIVMPSAQLFNNNSTTFNTSFNSLTFIVGTWYLLLTIFVDVTYKDFLLPYYLKFEGFYEH